MEILQQARNWIAFLGWLNLIGGVLSVLLGLFAGFQALEIAGGILAFVAGYFLIKAAAALKQDLAETALENLRMYFTFQGILALIVLAGTVIALLALAVSTG